jgi:hypothetical protein
MDPASWDDDAVVRKPVKKPKAVVSVTFTLADLELIAAKARESGATVSGYVREAAVAQARNPVNRVLAEAHKSGS